MATAAVQKEEEQKEEEQKEDRRTSEQIVQQDLNQGMDTGTHRGVNWGPDFRVRSTKKS